MGGIHTRPRRRQCIVVTASGGRVAPPQGPGRKRVHLHYSTLHRSACALTVAAMAMSENRQKSKETATLSSHTRSNWRFGLSWAGLAVFRPLPNQLFPVCVLLLGEAASSLLQVLQWLSEEEMTTLSCGSWAGSNWWWREHVHHSTPITFASVHMEGVTPRVIALGGKSSSDAAGSSEIPY